MRYGGPGFLRHPVYTVSHKKWRYQLIAVTSSNLNRFSKFVYHNKDKDIFNKIHVLFPTYIKYVAALPLEI